MNTQPQRKTLTLNGLIDRPEPTQTPKNAPQGAKDAHRATGTHKTPHSGPTEEQKEWRRDIRAKLLALLRLKHPAVFNPDKPVPLAVGITDALTDAYPQISKTRFKHLMIFWTQRYQYLDACSAGAMRYDLDGTPTAPVTLKQAEWAGKQRAERYKPPRKKKHAPRGRPAP